MGNRAESVTWGYVTKAGNVGGEDRVSSRRLGDWVALSLLVLLMYVRRGESVEEMFYKLFGDEAWWRSWWMVSEMYFTI